MMSITSLELSFDLPMWYLGAVFGTVFYIYYWLEAVKQPLLVCSEGKFKNFLSSHVPVLQEKYWPTVWCFESRLQTILANLLRSVYPKVKYYREILKLNDGGEVALDWLEDGCAATAPIVIILPGAIGHSQSQYIRCLVLSANHMKFRVVVFNYRGLGGMSLKCNTIREFDSAYTAKYSGYKDVNAYYADASIHDKLRKIEVPMLCLSSGDDPLQPYEAIPVEEARKSKYVAIVITQRGGHVGFLEGILPVFHEEYICRLFTQYFNGVFTSGSEQLASINNDQ